MIRQIGTKEHTCVKVKVCGISCKVIEFVLTVKVRLMMKVGMQVIRSTAVDYKFARGCNQRIVLVGNEMGDWRLDLVPNEQALHNVLASIRDMCMGRPAINDMCIRNKALMLQECFVVQ